MVKKKKKQYKKSDLNRKNSMTSKKVLGEFNEDFRVVPIIDRGHGNRNIKMMDPLEDGKENQQKAKYY